MTPLDRIAALPVRPLAILGAAVSLVGFVALVDLGVATTINFGTLALTVVGLVATAEGVRLLVAARGVELETPDLGEPEAARQHPTLGASLDERLGSGALDPDAAADLRDRFRAVAIEELARSRQWTAAEARAALDDGSWTDDDVAAAFASPTLAYPVGRRLSARLRGAPVVADAFERAVDALATAADPDTITREDTTQPDRPGTPATTTDADGATRDGGDPRA